jgi:hypothetical protein
MHESTAAKSPAERRRKLAPRNYYPMSLMANHHINKTLSFLEATVDTELADAGYKFDVANFHTADALSAPTFAGVMIQAARAQFASLGKAFPSDPIEMTRAVAGDVACQDFVHRYRWKRLGRHIYTVDEEMARAMMNTDMVMPASDIVLPVPTFYIGLPLGMFQVWHEISGWHDVDGVYVSEISAKGAKPEDSFRGIHILVAGVSKKPDDPSDAALFHYPVLLSSDMTFDEAVKLQESQRLMFLGKNADVCAAVARLVAGICMYLQQDGADVEPLPLQSIEVPALLKKAAEKMGRKKGDAMISEFRARYRSEVFIVGSGYESKAPQLRYESSPSGGTYKAQVGMVFVRGHMRRQPHGPKNSLRKWIWVTPYSYGEGEPSTTTVVTHIVQE